MQGHTALSPARGEYPLVGDVPAPHSATAGTIVLPGALNPRLHPLANVPHSSYSAGKDRDFACARAEVDGGDWCLQ